MEGWYQHRPPLFVPSKVATFNTVGLLTMFDIYQIGMDLDRRSLALSFLLRAHGEGYGVPRMASCRHFQHMIGVIMRSMRRSILFESENKILKQNPKTKRNLSLQNKREEKKDMNNNNNNNNNNHNNNNNNNSNKINNDYFL